ncbi:unnamed protein product [Diplocarpon coronariae]
MARGSVLQLTSRCHARRNMREIVRGLARSLYIWGRLSRIVALGRSHDPHVTTHPTHPATADQLCPGADLVLGGGRLGDAARDEGVDFPAGNNPSVVRRTRLTLETGGLSGRGLQRSPARSGTCTHAWPGRALSSSAAGHVDSGLRPSAIGAMGGCSQVKMGFQGGMLSGPDGLPSQDKLAGLDALTRVHSAGAEAPWPDPRSGGFGFHSPTELQRHRLPNRPSPHRHRAGFPVTLAAHLGCRGYADAAGSAISRDLLGRCILPARCKHGHFIHYINPVQQAGSAPPAGHMRPLGRHGPC